MSASALVPSSVTTVPFTLTWPPLISSSALRREAIPAAAIIFCRRSAGMLRKRLNPVLQGHGFQLHLGAAYNQQRLQAQTFQHRLLFLDSREGHEFHSCHNSRKLIAALAAEVPESSRR